MVISARKRPRSIEKVTKASASFLKKRSPFDREGDESFGLVSEEAVELADLLDGVCAQILG